MSAVVAAVVAALVVWVVMARPWRRIARLHRPRRQVVELCEVCGAEARWELRSQPRQFEGDPTAYTGMAATYCRRHKPAGAVKA